MKSFLGYLLTMSILFFGALFGVAAQGVDPDALLASFAEAKTAYTAALAALTQEAWETPAEFNARKASFGTSEEAVPKAYRAALAAVESASFVVPKEKVDVALGTFNAETKAWPVTVVSLDPAVPFSGEVIFSIAGARDIRRVFTSVDNANKEGRLDGYLRYKIQRETEGKWRVANISLVLLPGEASIGLPVAFVFTAPDRGKPEKASFLAMVTVQGGRFQMGSSAYGEGPVHAVTLSNFQMGRTEVTQGQWRVVMANNPRSTDQDIVDNHPVSNVSWYDTLVFCNKLSMIEGLTPVYTLSQSTDPARWGAVPENQNPAWDAVVVNWRANGYRLPTEAEWEYVARGGRLSRGFTFAGGNEPVVVAWYGNNSGYSTHPVATKAPNELGLYDMSGNVWEWCWDWHGNYTAGNQSDPKGPTTGSSRGLRSGSWGFDDDSLRSTNRSSNSPSYRGDFNPLGRDNHYGFRVVRP